MMGETCVYYPCAMFCKKEYDKGTFGDFVFGESQYYHDISHFHKAYREDPASVTLPPFYYPTHSTAMLLHATGAHVLKVTGVGYQDKEPDNPHKTVENPWGNPFSNEFSLISCPTAAPSESMNAGTSVTKRPVPSSPASTAPRAVTSSTMRSIW